MTPRLPRCLLAPMRPLGLPPLNRECRLPLSLRRAWLTNARDGYRFAKHEGESFFTIAEKPLQIAGF